MRAMKKLRVETVLQLAKEPLTLLQLHQATGLYIGTIVRILAQYENAGLVESFWLPSVYQDRPRRRVYRWWYPEATLGSTDKEEGS